MADIVNLNPLGEDSIKGGIFFGSSLVPLGSFSNVPRYYTVEPTEQQQASITLSLKKIKDSLKIQLQDEYNYTSSELNEDDATVEKFLYEFTSLLIDYTDMRNFIFFGSARTEIAYNIKYIIDNYQYKTLIADPTTAFTNINLSYDPSSNETTILFNDTTIRDIGSFKIYDTDTTFQWSNYEVEDKNKKRYTILEVIAPYDGPSIFDIQNITVGVQSMKITTVGAHGYLNGQSVDIYEVLGVLQPNQTTVNVNNKFNITNVTANSFEVLDFHSNDIIFPNFTYTSGGKVRLLPLDMNISPFTYKIIIKGRLTINELINYQDVNNLPWTGFMISPIQKNLNDFDFNLNPIQKALLAPPPINNTPWPRRIVTNNIQNRLGDPNPSLNDIEFIDWLANPDLLFKKNGSAIDDDVAFSDVYGEYNIVRAQSLDETTTNQFVRRCIPQDAISEINDTPDGYFQRFILIAGWFFDQINLYIKFIKYVHTLNYGDFNQLSPEYYKYYASYYGFDLFSDDGIDFSKLVVKTEPGLSYATDTTIDINNKYYRYTLQQLQYQRQKRLLLSLFYLYRTKGTQFCIKQLVSLLGAPEGLLQLSEYAFKYNSVNSLDYNVNNDYSTELIIDNDKVHVPSYHFEIDPDYLKDKKNIANSINKPYVYRMRLHNESTTNLRQIGINTDPNEAISNQIKNFFGNLKYDYLKFSQGQFANLQNIDNNFYYLPLSFPDKYMGWTINYMIPREGYNKNVGNNLEECNVHLGSLVLSGSPKFKNPSAITGITLQSNNTIALIQTNANHNLVLNEPVLITGVNGITNINLQFLVSTIPTTNSFTVIGDFTGLYVNGGIANPITPSLETKGFNKTYLLPEVFSNYDDDSNLNPSGKNPDSDFDILRQFYPYATYMDKNSIEYVFVRLEGKDLVIRLKFFSEYKAYYNERVTIVENIFDNDGLNHTLRLLFRPRGVEVYLDYEFKELAKWRDPSSSDVGMPFTAYEIPKKDIKTCQIVNLSLDDLIAPNGSTSDKTRWWDLFVGLPVNVDFYFQKVSIFENVGIDDYNLNDKLLDFENSNVDTFAFNFKNTTESSDFETSTQCNFYKGTNDNPVVIQNYFLPTIQNSSNELVVRDLNLFTKTMDEIFQVSGINTSTITTTIENDIEENDMVYFENISGINYKNYYTVLTVIDRFNFTINDSINITYSGNGYVRKLDRKSKKFSPQMKQEFFTLGEDIFKEFGWQSDIHKAYFYKNFWEKVVKLYNLYSPQVLTYPSLANFLDLIETKFKRTIRQFIPIVINFSEFGRLIQNIEFNKPKNHYPRIHDVCIGEKGKNNAFVQTKVFDEEGESVTWSPIDPYCIKVTTTTSSTSTTTSTTSSTTTSTTTLPPTTTTTSTTTSTTTIPVPLIQISMVQQPSSQPIAQMLLTATTINGPSTQNFSFRFGQCNGGSNGTFCNGFPSAPINQSTYGTISFNTGNTTKFSCRFKYGNRRYNFKSSNSWYG